MIQDEGIVSTGAGTHSPHLLQVTVKSQNRAGGSPNTEPSIGEQKAKSRAAPKRLFGTCISEPSISFDNSALECDSSS
jgi:hypothetical protein